MKNMIYSYEILGEIVPKKNRWKRGKYGQVYLEKDAQDNFDDIVRQLVPRPGLAGECRIWMIIYTKTNKADLDGQLTTIADALQTAGVIVNDRNIKKIEAEQIKVKKNPRAEIKIELLNQYEQK